MLILSSLLLVTALSDCGELCSEPAIRHYGQLLAESDFGNRLVEKAAFVVSRNGGVEFVRWPLGGIERATFRGVVPKDCIAIVHTHPRRSVDPSDGDVAVAKRLGLPVLVLTPRALAVAGSDGSTRHLFNEVGWWLNSGPRP